MNTLVNWLNGTSMYRAPEALKRLKVRTLRQPSKDWKLFHLFSCCTGDSAKFRGRSKTFLLATCGWGATK